MRPNGIFAALLLAGVLAGCDGRSGSWQEPEGAAARGLQMLKELTSPEEYSEMGFDSVAQLRRATLGEPLQVVNVDVAQLRSYAPGSPVEPLLTETNLTVYPVEADGAVRSSVTVVKQTTGYEPTSLGDSGNIQLLSRYRRNGANDVLVRVPALDFTFVGTRSAGGLLLTPVAQDERIPAADRPAVGQPAPASRVLAPLIPLAVRFQNAP